MNFDASFSATPGVARRLLTLASLGKITVDEDIIALSRLNLVPEEFFVAHNHTPEERRAVQFIRDCDYRCMIPFSAADVRKWTPHGEKLILSSLAFEDAPRPITVATQDETAWRLALLASKDIQKSDVVITSHQDACKDANFTKERRAGVLIITWDEDDHGWDHHRALVREFPRSIATGHLAQPGGRIHTQSGLGEMASAMFPEMPTALLTKKMVANTLLRSYGYMRTRVGDIAPLFNLFIPLSNLIPSDSD